MIKLLQLLVFFLLSIPVRIYAEDVKQLTPNRITSALADLSNDKAGYLAHNANFNSVSGICISSLRFLNPAGFRHYGALNGNNYRQYMGLQPDEIMHYN
ncbi:hypothetical protein [Adhaeribacter aerolatus]|uniref:hypothetical protein n=1 Tax=Adhaeribacter aerolatus TaxID=670289 RepID=UPI0011BE182F|nr:hypothetical protein [Adhaeribacter aerolatus]